MGWMNLRRDRNDDRFIIAGINRAPRNVPIRRLAARNNRTPRQRMRDQMVADVEQQLGYPLTLHVHRAIRDILSRSASAEQTNGRIEALKNSLLHAFDQVQRSCRNLEFTNSAARDTMDAVVNHDFDDFLTLRQSIDYFVGELRRHPSEREVRRIKRAFERDDIEGVMEYVDGLRV
jgi:hypothetical protein